MSAARARRGARVPGGTKGAWRGRVAPGGARPARPAGSVAWALCLAALGAGARGCRLPTAFLFLPSTTAGAPPPTPPALSSSVRFKFSCRYLIVLHRIDLDEIFPEEEE